ncbi:anti-phage ZorAB system protein ZorA [Rheinheimera sp. FR7-31]|uniref:anti-phage ZorAB system protein ZorA n=1 Tax=Rheinheimera fenheensis TaxID=3152295 RepID=UPI00325CCF7D
MDTSNYSLTKLWPEFGRLWAGDFTSPEGLSALFVAALFALAILFSVLSVINYFRASRHLRFYKRLIKGLDLDQLLDKRRELVNTALQNQTYGRLWREFDESLVHIPQKQRLCNTLDAAHFFNTHTISRGLTENRLLAAVPGFLTAIGVIGTFAGLQLGLGPLGALDPANAKVDDLTHGIFGMIGGASIAFMTSVWGVLISVLFNFFEKCLERNIRSSISSFQNEVDYLYPRITAEQSLSNIEDFTRQSNDRLAELDEKIGHKMQEAMKEASNVISDSVAHSLNTILGPAIERLVDNAHSGSEKALESLLDRFLQGVGSAGDSQKAMMEQAAKDITAASNGMTNGLNQFASKLDGQVSSMMQKNAEVLDQVNGAVQQQLEAQSQQEQQRQQQLTESIDQFMSGMKVQLALVAEQNANTLKAVQGELSGQIDQQQSRDASRQQLLNEQLQGLQANQDRVTQSIDAVLATQKEQNAELLAGLQLVIDRFAQLSNSHQDATGAMQAVSVELKASANQLGLLSSNLKAATNTLGEQLLDAVSAADDVTKSNAETSDVFTKVLGALQQAGEQITTVSGTLNDAAGKAEHGLTAVETHFDSLAKTLQSHLTEVQQQVADLLSEYGDRVKDQTVARLNTWNEHTNQYISAMTDAVKTLSSVVDEIDGKVSRRHEGAAV